MREPPPPIPTLEQLQKDEDWLWVYCTSFTCTHHKAMKLAPLIERWGPNTSSDRLRQSGRCTKCGHKGATLRAPSWINSLVGVQKYPGDQGYG